MGKNPEVFNEISQQIYWVRGKRVMLDSDLAKLYGVETSNLNKSVKRNIDRFPEDFMFQVTQKELSSLIFQIGISKEGRGGTRFLPHVFTQAESNVAGKHISSEENQDAE